VNPGIRTFPTAIGCGARMRRWLEDTKLKRMLGSTRNRSRSRDDAALSYRIVRLEAALESATKAYNDACRELAHLRAENSRLLSALDERRRSDSRSRPLPETTAGASVGRRHPRVVADTAASWPVRG
jgi:hypothetical protein